MSRKWIWYLPMYKSRFWDVKIDINLYTQASLHRFSKLTLHLWMVSKELLSVLQTIDKPNKLMQCIQWYWGNEQVLDMYKIQGRNDCNASFQWCNILNYMHCCLSIEIFPLLMTYKWRAIIFLINPIFWSFKTTIKYYIFLTISNPQCT